MLETNTFLLQEAKHTVCNFGRVFNNNEALQVPLGLRANCSTKVGNTICSRKNVTSYPQRTLLLKVDITA